MSEEYEVITALSDLGISVVFVVAWFWERRRSASIQDDRVTEFNRWLDRLMALLENDRKRPAPLHGGDVESS